MSIIKNGKKIAGLYKTDLVTPATDTQAGIIKIATEEEVQSGISNNTAITPYQLANQSPDKNLVIEYATNAIMPDYTTEVMIWGSNFSPTYKGWLIGYCGTSGDTNAVAWINGKQIGAENSDWIDIQILMDIGDIFTSNAEEFGLSFYALKGAN